MEPIHIKIDFNEAIDSKRDILRCEMSFLNLLNKLKSYQNSREEELEKKIELRNRLRDVRLGIERIKNRIPRLKSVKREEKTRKEKIEEIEKKNSIELELKDIKEKLEKLSF